MASKPLSLQEQIKSDSITMTGLINSLSHGPMLQRSNAAKALRDLASKGQNRAEIARQGGIPPLVDLLNTGGEQARAHAACCLGNLAKNSTNSVTIGKAGALDALVDMARKETLVAEDRGKEKGCFAIEMLIKNKDNRKLIDELNKRKDAEDKERKEKEDKRKKEDKDYGDVWLTYDPYHPPPHIQAAEKKRKEREAEEAALEAEREAAAVHNKKIAVEEMPAWPPPPPSEPPPPDDEPAPAPTQTVKSLGGYTVVQVGAARPVSATAGQGQQQIQRVTIVKPVVAGPAQPLAQPAARPAAQPAAPPATGAGQSGRQLEFRDPNGVWQGPYAESTMQTWCSSGYTFPEVRVYVGPPRPNLL